MESKGQDGSPSILPGCPSRRWGWRGWREPRCPVTCAPCAWLGACGDGGFWTPSSGGWFGAVIRPSPGPVVLCWPTCPNARGQMVGLHGRWLWEHRFPSRHSERRNGARCLLAGGCGFSCGAGGQGRICCSSQRTAAPTCDPAEASLCRLSSLSLWGREQNALNPS